MSEEAAAPRERVLGRQLDDLTRFALLVDADPGAAIDLVGQAVRRTSSDLPNGAIEADAARVWIVRAALSQDRRLENGLAADVDVPLDAPANADVRSAFAASSRLQRCVTVLHWFEHLDADGIAAAVGSTADGIEVYLRGVRTRLGLADGGREQALRRMLRAAFDQAQPDSSELAHLLGVAPTGPGAQAEAAAAAAAADEQQRVAARAEQTAADAERRAADADRRRRDAEQAVADAERERAATEARTADLLASAEQAAAVIAGAAAAVEAGKAAADREIVYRVEAEAAAAQAREAQRAAEQAVATAEKAGAAALSAVERTERTLLELTAAVEQQRRAAEAARRERDVAVAATAEATAARDEAERAAAAAEQRRAQAERDTPGPDDSGPGGAPPTPVDDPPRHRAATPPDGTTHRVALRRPTMPRLHLPRAAFAVIAAALAADQLAWQGTRAVHRANWWFAVPLVLLGGIGAVLVVLLAVALARGPRRPEPGLDPLTALVTAGTVLDVADRDLVRGEFRPALDAARTAVTDARRALETGRAGAEVLTGLRRKLGRLARAMLRAAPPTYAEIHALGLPSGFLELDLGDPDAAAPELERLARRARPPLAAIECARDLLAVVEPGLSAPRPGLRVARGSAALAVLVSVAPPVALLFAGALPWRLGNGLSVASLAVTAPLLVLGAVVALGLARRHGVDLVPRMPSPAVRAAVALALGAAAAVGAVRLAVDGSRVTTAIALAGVAALLVLVVCRPRRAAAAPTPTPTTPVAVPRPRERAARL